MKNQTKMSAEKVEIKQKTKLQNIKLEKLRPFEEHPYKIVDDESMEELKNSIQEKGLLNRIIVRPIENTDEYEIISGHRRVHAAEFLGIKEVPAVVYFIDRDEATVLMVDSNCQRESLSPMEKAKAYKMKLDAIKHQGTSRQLVGKSEESAESVSEIESGRTVQRFIRLTYLVPELQGRLPIRVELQPLGKDELKRILTEPEHSLIRQSEALLGTENVTLDFQESAIEEIAFMAEKMNLEMENIGARRLHTIMEQLLENISFSAPEHQGETFVIDKTFVDSRLENLIEDRDLRHYLL